MLRTGAILDLRVLRHTSVGIYLGTEGGDEVLLPFKYCPADAKVDDMLRVFVYRDHAERHVATTEMPRVDLDGFAYLRVFDVGPIGAFVEWGPEKHLLVPFKEQGKRMEPGHWYVVYMGLDERTDRLFGSTRIERYLNNERLTVKHEEAVDVLLFGRSDLGWKAIVNDVHLGLLHFSDVFRKLSVGDRLTGYIKTVRPDGKLDLALQAPGFRNYNGSNVDVLAERLQRYGSLPFTDRSDPQDIMEAFGFSKKAFKQALGTLYRERKVRITDDGVEWIAAKEEEPPV